MPPRTLFRELPLALAGVSAILLGAGRNADATAITLGAPWLLVDDASGNDIGKTPGTTIKIGDDTVVPNGFGGTTGVATITNLGTGAAVSRSLAFVGSTAIPNQFERVIPYNSNLLGPWTLSFTNGTDSNSVTTGSLVGAVAPPAGSVNGVFFDLFDKSRHEAAGGPDIVYSHTIPGNTGMFTVPTTLARRPHPHNRNPLCRRPLRDRLPQSPAAADKRELAGLVGVHFRLHSGDDPHSGQSSDRDSGLLRLSYERRGGYGVFRRPHRGDRVCLQDGHG